MATVLLPTSVGAGVDPLAGRSAQPGASRGANPCEALRSSDMPSVDTSAEAGRSDDGFGDSASESVTGRCTGAVPGRSGAGPELGRIGVMRPRLRCLSQSGNGTCRVASPPPFQNVIGALAVGRAATAAEHSLATRITPHWPFM